MKAEELVYEERGSEFTASQAGAGCWLGVWADAAGVHYGVVLNPTISADQRQSALEWCAELIDRVAEYGLERAVELDGWQRRSDGRFQLWGREHLLPDV